MGVFIREKRGRLYLDYRVNGRRYWESLHLTVGEDKQHNREAYRLAETIRSKLELKIVTGEHGMLDPSEGRRSLVAYAESLASKQHPKNPLPKSLRYLRDYAGDVRIAAVTEKWIDGYRDYLLSREEIGKATAGKYLAALGTVLRRAVRDLVIPHNPMEAVRGIRAPETVKVYLTPEELAKLAASPIGGDLGATVKVAFLFACLTGLRISDLRTLAWGDIERSGDWSIRKRQAKTERTVVVPLNEAAVRLVNDGALHKREELVFPRLTASKANTNQYLTTWTKATGIEKAVGWHTARHTFATLTLESGADFATVSRLLGHTKLGTTLTYAKSTDRAKREAVDGLPDLNLTGRKV